MIDRLVVRFRCLPKTYKVFIIIIILSITATALLDNIFTFANWAGVRFFPVEARWQLTMSGSAHILRTRVLILPEYPINYFYSFEEALDAYFGQEVSVARQELVRFESEKELLVIFGAFLTVNNVPRTSLASNMFLVDGDMISYPLYMWWQDPVGSFLYPRRVYLDEDRIARDIAWSFVAKHVTSRVNSGQPIYYGVGLGSLPLYMSILGYEPDFIMPFIHDGNEYFFWYYLNMPLFCEVFTRYFTVPTENGGIRVATLRLGDVIDIFDIRIVR